jgi:hypothetical protein
VRAQPRTFWGPGGVPGRDGIKKPTPIKTHPKISKKTHLKNPLKMFLFLFFIFYENDTNFALSNRFFMNK